MIDKLTNNVSKTVLARLTLTTAAVLGFVLTPAASAVQTTSIAWNASPDSSVAGYAIYYGNQSGAYTYRIDAGTNTATAINDLTEGQTNFFVVKAYDANGVESLPSNEISYIVPGVMTMTAGINPGDMPIISFPVAPGHSYSIQATADFAQWTTIWTTTGVTNGWMQFQDTDAANLPHRFYRLAMN